MSGSLVVRFPETQPAGIYKEFHGETREQVVAAAAKYGSGSGRLLVICSGQRHAGSRALLVDAYDLTSRASVLFAQPWKLGLTLHGRLSGKPILLGEATPLTAQRRLP